MEEALPSTLCLQKARIHPSCSACIGQINDAVHGVISGVIEKAFSPSENQPIAEETGRN